MLLPSRVVPTEASEWDPLNQPGKNGITLVVLALAWLGASVGTTLRWSEAVGDVTWALQQMLVTFSDVKVRFGSGSAYFGRTLNRTIGPVQSTGRTWTEPLPNRPVRPEPGSNLILYYFFSLSTEQVVITFNQTN